MSERKTPLKLITILSVSLIAAFAVAGCTPESPPLPPLTQDSSLSESTASESSGVSELSSKEESSEPTEGTGQSSKEGSQPESAVTEPSGDREQSESPESLWDDSFGEALTVNYKWFGEGDTIEAQTTDGRLITELTEAVRAMAVGEETDHFVIDSNETLSFWNRTGNCLVFEFSGGTLMRDGTHYELTGYSGLKVLIKELCEKYSGENMEESFEPFTDQELEDMETVGKRMDVLTNSDGYNNASLSERREMVVAKLNELADEGLVIRDSIFADEDSDNVSFTYSCGVLGGVMLREWDPMMN